MVAGEEEQNMTKGAACEGGFERHAAGEQEDF